MSDNQHTPGPWTAGWGDRGHGNGDYIVLSPDDSVVIAKIETELRADAILIAAAPDLLAACEAMLPDFEYRGSFLGGTTPARSQHNEIATLVRAAIAKAKEE